ncbi:MAG: hypothetical protein JWO15_3846 [Sphingomonadales bacterium]|nr:hypothetical protein [Sphingomonadales bacterium]
MLQPAAILFPDAELWAVSYLSDALASRPEPYADALVSNAVPSPRVDRMVIVRRDGGQAVDLRDDARLSVRTWATTEQDAADLARLVAALLWAAPDGLPVVRVAQESGPSAVADQSGQALRYSVFTVRTRGEVLT